MVSRLTPVLWEDLVFPGKKPPSFCSFFEDTDTNRVYCLIFKRTFKMKNTEVTHRKTLKGAGYMAGALTGIIAAIATFVITENIAVCIPVLAGLSIPIGIIIERKLQTETAEEGKYAQKLMIGVVAIGLFFFLSLIFISKFI